MDKLSERLELTARDADFHGYHGNAALLREAAKLARRVEEAPVADVGNDGWVECSVPPELGQRVRLVREE